MGLGVSTSVCSLPAAGIAGAVSPLGLVGVNALNIPYHIYTFAEAEDDSVFTSTAVLRLSGVPALRESLDTIFAFIAGEREDGRSHAEYATARQSWALGRIEPPLIAVAACHAL